MTASNAMIDRFGRRITYVRMSVTDRCDLRCRYCMAEKMTSLPLKHTLTLEESVFIARGVKCIHLTGEPLVREGIGWPANSGGVSNNFCDGRNRIRVAASGNVFDLGHDQRVEFRDLLRSGGAVAADGALDMLLAGKPERHQFQ